MVKSKLLILILMPIMAINLSSQSYSEYVVISTKLNVRSKPNKNSKIIGVLNNGEQVLAKDISLFERNENEWQDCEQINNLYGCWTEINYQEKSGYVFSPFLGEEIMLFYEDSPIEYYPTVKYWYGVYFDSVSNREIIKEISTEVENKKNEFNNTSNKLLRTNQKQKSIFLLASNTHFTEREIGGFTKIREYRDKCKDYLEPGNRECLYLETKNNTVSTDCCYLISTGNYKMSEYGAILEDYKIFVADNDPPNSKFTTIQELTMYFEFDEGFKLEYCGDIDGDAKPDIIIRGCSTKGCNSVLFLSSKAESGKLLKKISDYSFYSDC